MSLLKLLADKVDVFFLPGRVRGGGVDGEFLGALGIESDGFALVFFLELGGFGGGDGGGGGADVVSGGAEGGVGGGADRVEGVLDCGWLVGSQQWSMGGRRRRRGDLPCVRSPARCSRPSEERWE